MTEWDAGAYHRESSLQEAMATEQLARLKLSGTERVLDIGCGDGRITAAISARLPAGSILGVDPSERMIQFAAHNSGAPLPPNLQFAVADVRQLGFENQFDLVLSFNALHWVPEQDIALKNIYNALKPGGGALLRFVGLGERKSLEAVIEDTRLSAQWSRYFQDFRQPFVHFTPEAYENQAQQEGFRVLECHLLDKSWDFKTQAGFTAFAQATFVEWTQVLPPDQQGEFIADVLHRYRLVVATSPEEDYTFKFYQLSVQLERN
uniref:Methyltransferase type 11 n=1 Tax=Cyanothece sp. (strain PCC 7425 / ATCC 29141) TaxID=395961 RepID=B8HU85_CYAP4